MREHALSVHVGDAATEALLRLPEAPGPHPLVVHAPGWMSTKDAGHYRQYHQAFAEAGIASLVLDYRSLRHAASAPVIDPAEMVEDVAAAIDVGRAQPGIREGALVTLGTGGVGAAVALLAAVADPAIAGAAMVSPIATGESWLAAMRSAEEHRELLARVEEDRRARARGEPPATVAPIGGITVPSPERARTGFKEDIRGELPDEVALETVERLLALRPIDRVRELGERPLLLIACRDDVAVPYEDAVQLADAAGPGARLVTLEDANSYRMHKTHWRTIAGEVISLVRACADID